MNRCVYLLGAVCMAAGIFAAQESSPAQTTSTTSPAATTNSSTAMGGVAITSDGLLRMREFTPAPAAKRKGDPALVYVSLSKIIAQLQTATEKSQELPEDVRFLHGLARVDYLFVFPREHDVVLAGPAEPFRSQNPLQPEGTLSNRPVVQLDDLITALRAVHASKEGTIFGCSLDLPSDARDIAQQIGQQFANASAAQQAAALKQAIGPQQVRILGVAPDSRVALAMVTADYRLKRIAMGAEKIGGIGDALSSGLAVNRVWFEPAYDPLKVSPDGLSYQFSGPRLKVLAGAQEFDGHGATPAASAFAKRFSEKMPDAAGKVEAIADLQNVTDLFLVASVIERDRLAEKSGLDLSWLLAGDLPDAYHPRTFPQPRTAETVVSDNGSVISEGGVLLNLALLALPRTDQNTGALLALRDDPTDSWFLAKPMPKN